MNKIQAYLIGLMCARGHILSKDRRIIIEFAHKNRTIDGIAYCPKCGDFATAKKSDNPDGFLICKSCGTKVDKSVKKTYEQQESTVVSIQKNIIPLLRHEYDIDFDVVGNEHMTFMVMDFEKQALKFDNVAKLFNGAQGFDSFRIPSEIYKTDNNSKIEFVNGFLDAAGFFNSGGWLNREGKNGNGRMRAYLQIVRNWDMPVLICNFLKNEMKLPIHTIDWGHPNIRDSGMQDYYNSNPLSWSREHQVKFFPEYYSIFKLRIKHKQDMFNELIQHNKKVIFENSDDCEPPKPITKANLKSYHFGENDPRIPVKARKHYDAYWQVCHDLGCLYTEKCIAMAKNKQVMYITGKDEKIDPQYIAKEYDLLRNDLTKNIVDKYKSKDEVKEKTRIETKRTNPEQQLYEPITIWLNEYLRNKYKEDVKVHDTSSFYLDKFIAQNNLFDQFNFCEEFKIKPDIVGFLLKSKAICFIEVKIGELTIKDIGQLLGYCLVGSPKEAILISPQMPSINLIKILKSNKDILSFGENNIKIGTWKNNKCELLEI